jgi:hypothetical protein
MPGEMPAMTDEIISLLLSLIGFIIHIVLQALSIRRLSNPKKQERMIGR